MSPNGNGSGPGPPPPVPPVLVLETTVRDNLLSLLRQQQDPAYDAIKGVADVQDKLIEAVLRVLKYSMDVANYSGWLTSLEKISETIATAQPEVIAAWAAPVVKTASKFLWAMLLHTGD